MNEWRLISGNQGHKTQHKHIEQLRKKRKKNKNNKTRLYKKTI